jgi:hypothetical protein
MKEQIVNLKTATLARELGFNWKCKWCYAWLLRNNSGLKNHWGIELHSNNKLYYSGRSTKNSYSAIAAPTQSLLQKWIRENFKHNIIAHPYQFSQFRSFTYKYYISDDTGVYKQPSFGNEFEVFEDALEEGLFETLKILL